MGSDAVLAGSGVDATVGEGSFIAATSACSISSVCSRNAIPPTASAAGVSPADGWCYAYGLLLTQLITILAMYETARAYPGITPYVYFLIYLVLCSSFRGSRLMYCTKASDG